MIEYKLRRRLQGKYRREETCRKKDLFTYRYIYTHTSRCRSQSSVQNKYGSTSTDISMDSNTEAASDFFSSSSSYNSFYHEVKDDIIIDLGLSLGSSLQPEDPYHPSRNFGSPVEYGEFMGWPQLKSYMKSSEMVHPLMMRPHGCEDDAEGVQSSDRWVYVKVNMDGVVVGRKVCILDHACYSSLAVQLEDMFGKHSMSGLRLFQAESEFSLFYKDKNENWRMVGDVPWKNFLDCVKRLRIARKDEAHFSS